MLPKGVPSGILDRSSKVVDVDVCISIAEHLHGVEGVVAEVVVAQGQSISEGRRLPVSSGWKPVSM